LLRLLPQNIDLLICDSIYHCLHESHQNISPVLSDENITLDRILDTRIGF
jgi:hypothetical protein